MFCLTLGCVPGIALLDGNQDDIEKLAVRLRERQKQRILQRQEEMRKSWGLPPTNPGQQVAANDPNAQLQNSMAQMMGEMDDDVPVIKFGDASVAAPFTSKVSSVSSGNYHLRCRYVSTNIPFLKWSILFVKVAQL
jgi:cation-transporting ATPase 13A1